MRVHAEYGTADQWIRETVVGDVEGDDHDARRDIHPLPRPQRNDVRHSSPNPRILISFPDDSTHIIASNLTPSKFREFAKYKVVTPTWITDSVERGALLDWKAYKLVPKGGGEEEEMRGGMGKFLARASQAVQQKRSADHGSRGKAMQERPVEVMDDSEDEGVDQSTPRVTRPQVEAAFELAVPVEKVDSLPTPLDHPVPLAVVPSNPPTPTKRTPLAPVFTKSPAPVPPPAPPDVTAEQGLQYPRDAPLPTTDQRAFERAAAMGWYATRTENPDAKRLMKSAEWREQHTAANEGFLEGYYQNSRCVRDLDGVH
jgi:DNA repair protein REV1